MLYHEMERGWQRKEKGEGFTKRKESEIHVTPLTHKIKMGSLGEKT